MIKDLTPLLSQRADSRDKNEMGQLSLQSGREIGGLRDDGEIDTLGLDCNLRLNNIEVSQKFDLALAPGRSHRIHVPDFKIHPSVDCVTLTIQFVHEVGTFLILCAWINKATQS